MLPKVIRFAHADDAIGRHIFLQMPNISGFVVLLINRYIELVFRDFQHLSKKLPGPGNRFFFEIIAERKVAQHFKESAVPTGFADIINIARADALLTGCHSFPGRNFLTGKISLQRRHTAVDQ